MTGSLIPSAPTVHTRRTPATLVDLLAGRCARDEPIADQPAVTYLANGDDASATLSLRALDARARAWAAVLQEHVAPTERVLLVLPAGLDYITGFLAALYAGAIAVPALPPANAKTLPRLQLIAADARPAIGLAERSVIERLQARGADAGDPLAAPRWIAVEDLAPATDAARLAPTASAWRQPVSQAADVAFLQYTSGSTGEPKGVRVTHGNILANLGLIQTALGLVPGDRVVSWLPPHHDMGLIGKILYPLFTGSHGVHMASAAFLAAPVRWLRALSTYRARLTAAPNFAYDLAVDRIDEAQKATLDLSALDYALNGAELVRPRTLRRFAQAFAPCGLRASSLVPVYGAAEATLLMTSRSRASVHGGHATIHVDAAALAQGRAVRIVGDEAGVPTAELVAVGPVHSGDHHVLLVDPTTARPLPEGRVGEVWAAGPSIADGYWNRPGATRETFVQPTASGVARYLRTGDLGVALDGQLHIAGRIKDLMIFGGRNVYPQDVERLVERLHPNFRQNGCVAFSLEALDRAPSERGEDGCAAAGARLVIVQELDLRCSACLADVIAPLRAELAEQQELVPLAAVMLVKAGHLPRTSSGKLQRRRAKAMYLANEFAAIDAWSADADETAADVPPGATERALAPLWSAVLGLAQVPRDRDFLALGGHSLVATQLLVRVRETFGVALPLRALFEAPTLRGLAACIDEQLARPDSVGPAGDAASPAPGLTAACSPACAGAPCPPAPLRPRPPGVPARPSFAQERLWFVQSLEGADPCAWNLSLRVALRGRLDADALALALQRLVARHESLRVRFIPGADGLAVDVVPTFDVPLSRMTLPGTRIDATARDWARHVFDLERGPLLRAALLHAAEDAERHVLLLDVHHLVADGTSLGLLLDQWLRLYDACCNGTADPLPAARLQYADAAHAERERAAQGGADASLAWWTAHLRGAPDLLALPTDRPRLARPQGRSGREASVLPPALVADIDTLARASQATRFMVLLSAYALVLSRHAGETDLVIGTPVARREEAALEDLVGLFAGHVPLRADLAGGPSFETLLARLRSTALDAFAHSDVPFERLVDALALPRDLSRHPVFQVCFNQVDLAHPLWQPPGLAVGVPEALRFESKFDLTLYAQARPEGVALTLNYDAALFDAPRMCDLLAQVAAVLAQVVVDPSRAVTAYALRTDAARRVLPDATVPLDATWRGPVTDWIDGAAAARPDAPAICAGAGLAWTRGALRERSDAVACWLQARGVGRGDVVTLLAARRAALVPALLGVLKAGAAFAMIDPAHPAAHRLACTAVARPRATIRLAAGACAEMFDIEADGLAPCLDLSTTTDPLDAPALADHRGGRPACVDIGANDLALIGFTAGSTGVPKAIEGRHGSLSHFLPWWRDTQGLGEDDTWALVSALTHDPLQRDVFHALALGGTLAVPEDTDLVPGCLAPWLAAHRVTALNLTPALAQWVCEAAAGSLPWLRRAFFIGDTLTRRDVRAIHTVAPAVHVTNLYGATETQRALSAHPVEREALAAAGPEVLPLGEGLPGTQLLVLDAHGRPAGIGELGELAIRSPHLAAGYRDDPSLTAARFVTHPATGDPAGRLYRTGDLGRHRADGLVEHAGRADAQVKLRGFRVEPGHLESIVASHSDVARAVVVVHGDAPEARALVAYVVARPGATLAPAVLHAHVRERVPAYLRPAHIVVLERLPLTAGGKVDRRALPDPPPSSRTSTAADAPGAAARTPTETHLLALWAEVLERPLVGVHDDFFEIGGHSLRAARVVARVRQVFGIRLSLARLFEAPTVAALAVVVDGELAGMEEMDL